MNERLGRIMGDEPLPPCREMVRFRDMLDMERVAWHDESDPLICRTRANDFIEKRNDHGGIGRYIMFSVISGDVTYGGTEGLLEVWMPWMTEPEGYHTADECMEMVRRAVSMRGEAE